MIIKTKEININSLQFKVPIDSIFLDLYFKENKLIFSYIDFHDKNIDLNDKEEYILKKNIELKYFFPNESLKLSDISGFEYKKTLHLNDDTYVFFLKESE